MFTILRTLLAAAVVAVVATYFATEYPGAYKWLLQFNTTVVKVVGWTLSTKFYNVLVDELGDVLLYFLEILVISIPVVWVITSPFSWFKRK